MEAEEKSLSTTPATVPAAATPSAAPPHCRHRAAPPHRPVGMAVSGDPPAFGPLESRSDTGARETRRESRVRGRRNGEGKAEVRSCGRERRRSGRWRGEWSSFRDPAGPLVGAGGRRGSAYGSAGRTPRGQNHGVERYPYAFLGVEIMKYIFTPYLFNVINIHIIHYKLSQTSNSLTGKGQSGHSLRDRGST
jgi:hypothetical protein